MLRYYRTTRNMMWVAAAVAPAAVALVLVERPAAHHDGPDAVEHLLQDGPVLVGRRIEHPVVQHPGAVAERVLTAVIRAGDVPVERDRHVANHGRHEWFLSVRPIGPIQTVLTDKTTPRGTSHRPSARWHWASSANENAQPMIRAAYRNR